MLPLSQCHVLALLISLIVGVYSTGTHDVRIVFHIKYLPVPKCACSRRVPRGYFGLRAQEQPSLSVAVSR